VRCRTPAGPAAHAAVPRMVNAFPGGLTRRGFGCSEDLARLAWLASVCSLCLCSATSVAIPPRQPRTRKPARSNAIHDRLERGYRARYECLLIGMRGQASDGGRRLTAVHGRTFCIVQCACTRASLLARSRPSRHDDCQDGQLDATMVGCVAQPDSTALLHAGGDGPHLPIEG
jgi:hypothetical protein